MMNDVTGKSATDHFRRARKRATLEDVVAHLTGKPADLLCYPDVREKLKVKGREARVLQEIPLAAIVGSVERCCDFTRSFLPRKPISQHRWTSVEMALTKWPPIEAYEIDHAYFVLDGHHRVSVARQRGISHIHAYVTEICTRVPLDAAILDHFEASPETLWKRRSCYTGLTATTVPISEGVRL